MTKIKPFGNNILVKPIEKKQILVSDNRTLCEYGEVLGVGSEVKEVKEGDKIGFVIWGLNSLEVDGQKHYFVREDSDFILGTFNESME